MASRASATESRGSNLLCLSKHEPHQAANLVTEALEVTDKEKNLLFAKSNAPITIYRHCLEVAERCTERCTELAEVFIEVTNQLFIPSSHFPYVILFQKINTQNVNI